MSNKFLLDLPEKIENDVIGFEVYVDDIIDAVNSDACMVGLLANYGSGKSSVINMAKEKIEKDNIDNKDNVKFISINLWKITEKKSNQKSSNNYDETICIHKFLLNKLISYLPETSNRNYFENKINGRYSLFNISLKDKKDIYFLYILFALFLFNIIMKFEFGDFSVARIGIFVLDLAIVLNLVFILARAKFYLSFTKDSTNRIINESDTSECFKEVIQELQKCNRDKKIVICIEDLDRYNDADFVIKILEQIYKFYVEYDRDLNVKFLISLKQPYLLVEDHIKSSTNNFENNKIGKVKEYKELYEKIFDLIINLQTVSIQSFSSVVLGMISKKKKELYQMGIIIPEQDNSIGVWSYLYYGNNVSLRDIKHRFNYFIILYENLWRHKKSLEKPELFEINLTTCLFVSFLEDAYSSEFYELVNDPESFKKMVSEYLFTKEFIEPSNNLEFNNHIKNALKDGIIKSDYIMYFYKYPKKREIKNIFNNSIQNAIFTNSKHGISDFELYCKNASKDDIYESLKERNEFHGIPSIVFENKYLFDVARKDFFSSILKLLESEYIFSSENGLKNMQKVLPKLLMLKDRKIIDEYIMLLYSDLKTNYDDDKIVSFRKEIIKIMGLNLDLLFLYGNDMPLITYDEIVYAKNAKIVFDLISVEKIDESVLKIISYCSKIFDIKFACLIEFFDRIADIDENLFREIFYSFDFSKYSKLCKYQIFDKNYSSLNLNNIDDIKKLISKLEVLPVSFEKKIVKLLYSCESEQYEKFEDTYSEIIMIVNNISSETKLALVNFKYYHVYNEDIEEQLYQKEFYDEYIYSNINRTGMLSCVSSKFEVLKKYYLNYFMSEKMFDDKYYIETTVKKYLKDNLNYCDLDFRRIELLYDTPQTLEDLKIVLENRYKNPSELNWKKYLRGIKSIDKSEEFDFVWYLINKVKYDKFRLTLESYNCIRKLLDVGNVRRWQRIKHLCVKE